MFREFAAAEERLKERERKERKVCRLFCVTPECSYATDDDSLYYTHLQGCYPSAFASNGWFSFFSRPFSDHYSYNVFRLLIFACLCPLSSGYLRLRRVRSEFFL